MKRIRGCVFGYCVLFIIILAISGCTPSHRIVEGKNLSVIFFNVGQGDSALVLTPDNKKILVDCGEFNDTAIYLNAMNITKIDVLIETHPHKDHIGGCDYVRENVEVMRTITNENAEKDFFLDITDTVLLEVVAAYDSHGRFKDDNDNSVLLKVRYGDVRFLFTGDCEWKCENELIKTEDIDSDILKVGHHGSGHSSTERFLEKVSPLVGVISCGKNNSYGHPANETVQRLKAVNASIYRTDKDGNIIITTDGRSYSVIK